MISYLLSWPRSRGCDSSATNDACKHWTALMYKSADCPRPSAGWRPGRFPWKTLSWMFQSGKWSTRWFYHGSFLLKSNQPCIRPVPCYVLVPPFYARPASPWILIFYFLTNHQITLLCDHNSGDQFLEWANKFFLCARHCTACFLFVTHNFLNEKMNELKNNRYIKEQRNNFSYYLKGKLPWKLYIHYFCLIIYLYFYNYMVSYISILHNINILTIYFVFDYR